MLASGIGVEQHNNLTQGVIRRFLNIQGRIWLDARRNNCRESVVSGRDGQHGVERQGGKVAYLRGHIYGRVRMCDQMMAKRRRCRRGRLGQGTTVRPGGENVWSGRRHPEPSVPDRDWNTSGSTNNRGRGTETQACHNGRIECAGKVRQYGGLDKPVNIQRGRQNGLLPNGSDSQQGSQHL
jgi:hypothetical protein